VADSQKNDLGREFHGGLKMDALPKREGSGACLRVERPALSLQATLRPPGKAWELSDFTSAHLTKRGCRHQIEIPSIDLGAR